MGINEQYFSAAMERLEERRRANRLESDMRRSEVESKIPEYRAFWRQKKSSALPPHFWIFT